MRIDDHIRSMKAQMQPSDDVVADLLAKIAASELSPATGRSEPESAEENRVLPFSKAAGKDAGHKRQTRTRAGKKSIWYYGTAAAASIVVLLSTFALLSDADNSAGGIGGLFSEITGTRPPVTQENDPPDVGSTPGDPIDPSTPDTPDNSTVPDGSSDSDPSQPGDGAVTLPGDPSLDGDGNGTNQGSDAQGDPSDPGTSQTGGNSGSGQTGTGDGSQGSGQGDSQGSGSQSGSDRTGSQGNGNGTQGTGSQSQGSQSGSGQSSGNGSSGNQNGGQSGSQGNGTQGNQGSQGNSTGNGSGQTNTQSDKITPGATDTATISWTNEIMQAEDVSYITVDGIKYQVSTTTSPAEVSTKAISTISMDLPETSSTYATKVKATAFRLRSVAPAAMVALEVEGFDEPLVYTSEDYDPSSVGDLVSDLGLSDGISFSNSVRAQISRNGYTTNRVYRKDVSNAAWQYLFSQSAATRASYSDFRSGNVKLLFTSGGSANPTNAQMQFGVSDNGYLYVSVLKKQFTFHIGTEAAAGFIEAVTGESDMSEGTK